MEFWRYIKILKWNSYTNFKVFLNKHLKYIKQRESDFKHQNICHKFYHQFWILKTLSCIGQCRISEPEVQGQVEPSNCIISQFTSKFILAHVHWHILRQLFENVTLPIALKQDKVLSLNKLTWVDDEIMVRFTISVSCGGDFIVPEKYLEFKQ